MKAIHYTIFSVLCCLALWACDPKTSATGELPKDNPTENPEAESNDEMEDPAENTEAGEYDEIEDVSENRDEITDPTDNKAELRQTPIDDELVKEGEEGTITFNSASNFTKSIYSEGLKELVFYPEKETTERYSQITHLYPLGWSKGGNFAYVEYAMTYHLGHQMTYTIKNMNTGDTLWEEQIVYEMTDDQKVEEKYLETGYLDSETLANSVIIIKGDESDEELFKYAWLAGEEVVLKVLKKAGIIFNPSPAFLKQTNYQDISFGIEMKETEESDPIKYYLNSTAHNPVLISEGYLEAFDTRVWGILKSPYSETIAVVCMIKRQFFEMTNEVVPILVGYKV